VDFEVDRVAQGQVFSEYFGFLVNSHSANCSTFINYRCIDTVYIVSMLTACFNDRCKKNSLVHSNTLNHYFIVYGQYQQWKFVFSKSQDCNAD
jgi:hypothetical protein